MHLTQGLGEAGESDEKGHFTEEQLTLRVRVAADPTALRPAIVCEVATP